MAVKASTSPSTELSSWKEIADYLGVSVRTAQRYEQEMALPVRRLTGEKGRAVSAWTGELDAWKSKQNPAPRIWHNPAFLRWYALTATVLVLLMGGQMTLAYLRQSARGQPFSSQWNGPVLTVSDEQGRELWRKVFDGPLVAPFPSLTSQIDLNGDGRTETLIPLVTTTRESNGGVLLCFDNYGREIWCFQPKVSVSTPSNTYSDLYVLRHFITIPSPLRDGTQWIVATYAHHYEFPSVLVVLESSGKLRGSYWHSGHLEWLHAKDLNNDGGVELLAAGSSRATSTAIVKVLDPRWISGAEVLPAGHPDQLLNFPPARELATIQFPRCRLNRLVGSFNFATELNPASGNDGQAFRVHVSEELNRDGGYIVYSIRHDLSLSDIAPSASLRNTFRERTLIDPSFPPFSDADVEALRRGYTVRWGSPAAGSPQSN